MTTMFDKLLQLPLFQGISTDSLTTILDKVKLHFEKKFEGEVIVESGKSCDGLIFILHGEVEKTTIGMSENPYEVSEFMTAPYLIEPSSLFGMTTDYKSTYTACCDVDIMSVSKESLKEVLLKNDIFQLNYLNMLCRRYQNLESRIWTLPSPNTTCLICEIIMSHFETTTGRKSLYINIEDLAFKSNILRIQVKQILKKLEQQGLLQVNGRSINIPDASLLADYSHSMVEGGLEDMS